MKQWENRAIALLDKSLNPIPNELNELDWKSGLSNDSDRLAKHLSAFTNTRGGGFMVFGVNNDGGFTSIHKEELDSIIQKLGNIARNNLGQPVILDHIITTYREHPVLIVYIPEKLNYPAYKHCYFQLSEHKSSIC